MGEPAGIGVEIALKAWLALRGSHQPFVLLHDPVAVAERANAMHLDVPITRIAEPSEASAVFAGALPVLSLALTAPVVPGMLDARNTPAVIEAIMAGAIAGHRQKENK
jgi:4-hydroxythreonine-4-phosphate dehydrogenase